jgi:hypothetical protein
MALESATYIDDLNTANPAPTDLLGQGDDHIRLIKAVLKATFPNITGPVTLTQADLNGVLAARRCGGVPVGAITAWYGSSGRSRPAGTFATAPPPSPKSDGSGTITSPTSATSSSWALAPSPPKAPPTVAQTSRRPRPLAALTPTTTAGGGGHIHSGVTVAGHALTSRRNAGAQPHLGGNRGTGGGSLMTIPSAAPRRPSPNSSTVGGAAHTHDMAWPATPDGTHTHTTDTAATTPTASLALHYIMKVYQPAPLVLHYIMKGRNRGRQPDAPPARERRYRLRRPPLRPPAAALSGGVNIRFDHGKISRAPVPRRIYEFATPEASHQPGLCSPSRPLRRARNSSSRSPTTSTKSTPSSARP